MGYGVPDSGVDFFYVTVHEAYQLMKNDKAVFVDSRDEDDFRTSRIQTSRHLAANALIMRPDSVDKNLVQHLLDLVNSGKTVICISDACVKGNVNRGHVSRCRHIAQYLVEMGADRRGIVRMAGGINAWKQARLDGILGDLRPMYAGQLQSFDFKPPPDEDGKEEEEDDDKVAFPAASGTVAAGPLPSPELPGEAKSAGGYNTAPRELSIAPGGRVEITGLKSRADLNGKKARVKDYSEEAGRWEVELLDDSKECVRCKPESLIPLPEVSTVATSLSDPPAAVIEVGCGGDMREGGKRLTVKVRFVPSRPARENTPTAYRALKSDLFRKPTRDSDKIMKMTRPVSSIVRTTGALFTGPSGGQWAELDTSAGEKKGWVYIKGPGFGASSCKVTSEFLCS